MKARSLVGRLVRWQVTMTVLTWVVLVGWLFHMMTAFENGDLDRRMTYFAQILAETADASGSAPERLAQRLQATEKVFVEGIIETLDSATAYRATYQVYDDRGTLLYRTESAPAVPLAEAAGLSQVTRENGEGWRVARVRSSDGAVTVVVGESERERWASVWPMLQIIGGSQILMLASALLVTAWAARRGLRPLRALAAEIGRREAGDLAPVAVGAEFAETRPIVRELNALLDRESRRLENERGFLADAAHELRTPLAAIGTQAHLVLNAADDDERARSGRRLQDGLDRVSHLLAQLLAIARVDAPGAVAAREALDVAALVRERLADLAGEARRRAITLTLDGPERLVAVANRAGFVSIVDNLVDNAIRYAPSGGHVQVTLERIGDSLEFAVRDDGPGIAPGERERVFERFYRIPGSTAPGSGLGLAIVRRIAQTQRASIRFAEGLSGAGIGVLVTMPVGA